MRTLLMSVLIGLFGLMTHHATAEKPLDQPGPYSAGWSQVSISRPNGSTFTALLFYPAKRGGQGAPIDLSGSPYPAISFGHGFLQSPNQYRSTLEHLATWGYICIATESYQNLFPNHAAYAEDLSLCLTWLEQRSKEASSILHNAVDASAFGLSGHSMGGGASLLAAANDPRIKAVANLAAANTNPSAVNAAGTLTMPLCLIAGSQDTITPVKNHGLLMYNNATAPRQLPVIVGGFHCGFTDNTFPFCDSGAITRAEQLAITRRLLTAFFNLHLKGDQSLWQRVWGPAAATDPAVMMMSDPRVNISLDQQSITAQPGSAVQLQATISNAGPAANSFTILAEMGGTAIDIQPQQTQEVASQESINLTLTFTMPEQAGQVVISLRSQLDNATRGYAVLEVAPDPKVFGDLNGDGVVDVTDLLLLFGAWGMCPDEENCPADLNSDGHVDVSDLLLLLSNWG